MANLIDVSSDFWHGGQQTDLYRRVGFFDTGETATIVVSAVSKSAPQPQRS